MAAVRVMLQYLSDRMFDQIRGQVMPKITTHSIVFSCLLVTGMDVRRVVSHLRFNGSSLHQLLPGVGPGQRLPLLQGHGQELHQGQRPNGVGPSSPGLGCKFIATENGLENVWLHSYVENVPEGKSKSLHLFQIAVSFR